MSRPLKVGVQLPEVEREVRWPRVARHGPCDRGLGFDSHVARRAPPLPLARSSAPRTWEAWSMLAALAAVTTRVELGPLVACTNFHNPAILAKRAATIDEISGGRFILGLGAGWNETEFRAFGIPFDHRIDRFEEAFTIIRTLLREGAIDFEGTGSTGPRLRAPAAGPRPGGPPLMIGSNGARMLRITRPARRLVELVVRRHRQRACRRRGPRGEGRRGLRGGRARSGARSSGLSRCSFVCPAARGRTRATRRTPRPSPLEGPPERDGRGAPRLRRRRDRATSSWSSIRSPARRSSDSHRSSVARQWLMTRLPRSDGSP